jgi:hypothetical protein
MAGFYYLEQQNRFCIFTAEDAEGAEETRENSFGRRLTQIDADQKERSEAGDSISVYLR